MEISEKILKFKFHLLFAFIFSTAMVSVLLLAPRFVTILAYFWPLLLSTALFLLAVLLFGKTHLPITDDLGGSTGEGLLDYVAGSPPPPEQPIHSTE